MGCLHAPLFGFRCGGEGTVSTGPGGVKQSCVLDFVALYHLCDGRWLFTMYSMPMRDGNSAAYAFAAHGRSKIDFGQPALYVCGCCCRPASMSLGFYSAGRVVQLERA